VETLERVDPARRRRTQAAAVALLAFLALIPLSVGLLVAASHVDVVQRFCAVGGGPSPQSDLERETQDCLRAVSSKHSRAIDRKRLLRGAGIVFDLTAAACLVVAIRWAASDRMAGSSTER